MCLILLDMAKLEGWCVEEDRETTLPMFLCLRNLIIIQCPKLTTIPPYVDISKSYCGTQITIMSKGKKVFKHLKSLDWVYLRRCQGLTLLLENREETRPLSSSLHYLNIYDCNQFSLSTVSRNLTSLEDLEITHFDELVS